MAGTIAPAALADVLTDGAEFALLDAREEGVFSDRHLFHAACVPLSQVEMVIDAVVPRRSTQIIWCDDDGASEGLASKAAARATDLGWTDCHILEGGIDAWAANGGEVYSGVNVPSKAFGEIVEQTYGTPHISADDLKSLLDGQFTAAVPAVTVLDSRPMGEFRRRSIPTGVDCPGAELVHRVKEVVTDPDTLVVVNCAGRTRSIIGAQSLINAGVENRVVALENGTMGWELAGYETASGEEAHAPDPSPDALAWAAGAATGVGERFGVRQIDVETLASWQTDADRTTYLLDVRTDDEFENGHIPGSRHAPGGQLVQATDEYVATRNARIVLVDADGVRAMMTASWLRQLGWNDAVVLAGGLEAFVTASGGALAKGTTARSSVARASVQTIRPPALKEQLDAGEDVTVIDVGTSVKYRMRGHIPGSWWAIRSRMAEARAAIGDSARIVLTSTDGTLAKLSVADAAEHWPDADIAALAAGNKGWRHAGFDMEPGFDRATTEPDDVWYKPYDHDEAVVRQHMEDYLTWEVALVEQVERDPTVSFPTFA
ncbi:MAG: rhodanese-like domain-containing protein [Acidimicrobiales bacterium]